MRQECVTLSRKELKRVKAMEKLLGGGMSGKEAAATLGITERRLRRLKVKYSKEGEIGLIHGNRGGEAGNGIVTPQWELAKLYPMKGIQPAWRRGQPSW
ncbi:MAG: helix-turn-helix domain-containing protein [Synergistaceae bacterium]|nr:helix-turn-helix domain-containing protein [Synergistaceae bacterium]